MYVPQDLINTFFCKLGYTELTETVLYFRTAMFSILCISMHWRLCDCYVCLCLFMFLSFRKSLFTMKTLTINLFPQCFLHPIISCPSVSDDITASEGGWGVGGCCFAPGSGPCVIPFPRKHSGQGASLRLVDFAPEGWRSEWLLRERRWKTTHGGLGAISKQ